MTAPASAPPADAGPRDYDGVVCFGGEDWWYHNRGHYDMQMMRELSAHMPVLYVNSIGMRVPRVGEGRMFLTRVRRKLKSIGRGVVRVRDTFHVFSPLVAPGRAGMAASRALLPAQVRLAARRAGVRRPLVWVNCPPGVEAVDALQPAGLVYQRTDRYEEFKGVDRDLIRSYDIRLKRAADLTLFCSSLLYDEEAAQCRRAMFVDHGVDFDRFFAAGQRPEEPDDVRGLPRPRAGFIGGIDAHTFDPPLFLEVARRLPHVHFVLVGACSLPEGWLGGLTNVSLLGQKPYDRVPAYMAACDVLLMPWNQSEWIKACNPVKLKEYLAVGRPVITTPFDELRRYEGLVSVARGPEDFAASVAAAVGARHDPAPGRERVRRETWTAKADAVLQRLHGLGLAQTRPAEDRRTSPAPSA